MVENPKERCGKDWRLGRALSPREAPSSATPGCPARRPEGKGGPPVAICSAPPGGTRQAPSAQAPTRQVRNAAGGQGASAEAPGKGRSQFRRESGARLNPREAGPEPEGKALLFGRSALRTAGFAARRARA